MRREETREAEFEERWSERRPKRGEKNKYEVASVMRRIVTQSWPVREKDVSRICG